MKKIVLLILTLLLLLGTNLSSFAISEDDEVFVYDNADLLTDSEESDLTSILRRISQSYNAQVTVVTISSPGGSSMDRLVEDIYDSWNLGYGENKDGVLLLVCMGTREYRIISNGFPGYAINEEYIEKIGEDMLSLLSDGEYAEAFQVYADRCEYYLNGYINGFPFDFMKNLIISLVVGLVVGLIVVFALKSQLKSVRRKDHADVYVKPGSMKITRAADYFLYRRVTRIPRETSNSSGSKGGSSRSVGGGSF